MATYITDASMMADTVYTVIWRKGAVNMPNGTNMHSMMTGSDFEAVLS